MSADTLSRAYITSVTELGEGDRDIDSINMLHYVPVSTMKLMEIRQAMERT